MNVKAEILDYINRNELTGALLLTGQWGCGKSFLIKEIAKELNESKKAAVAIISLFGLDSVSAINKRVKDEYISFILGTLGKSARKLSKSLTTVVKDGLEVASITAKGIPGVSAASQGLSSIMSYDLLGFIEVENVVGKGEKTRKFVLVFDDLERSNLPQKDLLGTLNEYIENKQIRVVLIADEERIKDDEYKEYKEKLISRTIRMTADYWALIDSIICTYSETSRGYKGFLEENSGLLKQVFEESESNNLRTLKTAIADFERVFAAWKETSIPSDNMKWALYTFVTEMFIFRMPRPKEPDKDNKRSGFPYAEKENEKYAFRGKKLSKFSSLTKWIYSGLWDRTAFIQELIGKYGRATITPLERFMLYDIWNLEQKDIEVGLPAAIELAYKGDLAMDYLIHLLISVHSLKVNLITLPCEISYERIKTGFEQRSDMIKRGEITEPQRHTFAEKNQLDNEAFPLYEAIEKLNDQMIAWKNRRQYLDYLNGDSDSTGYFRRGLSIDVFDDELLDVFQRQYSMATNETKREYAMSLLSLAFDCNDCSTEESISVTQLNFERLANWLSSQDSNDRITAIINRQFADSIHKRYRKNESQ